MKLKPVATTDGCNQISAWVFNLFLHLFWLLARKTSWFTQMTSVFFLSFYIFLRFFFFLFFYNFTILHWFCHTSTWIGHEHTRVPHPEHLLPPPSLYHPSGSSQCTSAKHPVSCMEPGLTIHSYMILYMFQCHSPKSSHPLPLPQNPKNCSIHLCLFCCLAYRVIITIFLNSIYMH